VGQVLPGLDGWGMTVFCVIRQWTVSTSQVITWAAQSALDSLKMVNGNAGLTELKYLLGDDIMRKMATGNWSDKGCNNVRIRAGEVVKRLKIGVAPKGYMTAATRPIPRQPSPVLEKLPVYRLGGFQTRQAAEDLKSWAERELGKGKVYIRLLKNSEYVVIHRCDTRNPEGVLQGLRDYLQMPRIELFSYR
jgi:hypothetical protein